MSRLSPTIRSPGLLAVALAAALAPSCGPAPREEARSLLPDPQVARRALESALEEWRDTPDARTTSPGRSVLFVDQQRRPGQKLRAFEVLGASEVDNLRKYVVRLRLAEPVETVLAAYYVFDRSPIWVYRTEDFDMMMNMDMAPDDPRPPEGSAGAEGAGKRAD